MCDNKNPTLLLLLRWGWHHSNIYKHVKPLLPFVWLFSALLFFLWFIFGKLSNKMSRDHNVMTIDMSPEMYVLNTHPRHRFHYCKSTHGAEKWWQLWLRIQKLIAFINPIVTIILNGWMKTINWVRVCVCSWLPVKTIVVLLCGPLLTNGYSQTKSPPAHTHKFETKSRCNTIFVKSLCAKSPCCDQEHD